MKHEDPRRLSDALDREADELERRSSELQDQIDQTRQEWERKRADDGVPGAPPPEGQGSDVTKSSKEPPEASREG